MLQEEWLNFIEIAITQAAIVILNCSKLCFLDLMLNFQSNKSSVVRIVRLKRSLYKERLIVKCKIMLYRCKNRCNSTSTSNS